jgi:hypothetical protein
MKKPNHEPLAVKAMLAESTMLRELVEKLAHRKFDIGYNLEKVEPGSEAIDTSSIEAYVSGDIFLSRTFEHIKVPFDTSFLFTCIKGSNPDYKLNWINSLS